MQMQYRFIATNCTCNDRNPDSDTLISCDLQVQLKIKFINYHLQLLDEANLRSYPDATGYLTADNLTGIKPTHLGIYAGASWEDYDSNTDSIINGGLIVKDISNLFN